MARAIAEHGAIAAAIESGDGVRAAQAMGVHLDGLLTDIPSIRRLIPTTLPVTRPHANRRSAADKQDRSIRKTMRRNAMPKWRSVSAEPGQCGGEHGRAVRRSVGEPRLHTDGIDGRRRTGALRRRSGAVRPARDRPCG